MELREYIIEQRVNLFLKQISHNYFRRQVWEKQTFNHIWWT